MQYDVIEILLISRLFLHIFIILIQQDKNSLPTGPLRSDVHLGNHQLEGPEGLQLLEGLLGLQLLGPLGPQLLTDRED